IGAQLQRRALRLLGEAALVPDAQREVEQVALLGVELQLCRRAEHAVEHAVASLLVAVVARGLHDVDDDAVLAQRILVALEHALERVADGLALVPGDAGEELMLGEADARVHEREQQRELALLGLDAIHRLVAVSRRRARPGRGCRSRTAGARRPGSPRGASRGRRSRAPAGSTRR